MKFSVKTVCACCRTCCLALLVGALVAKGALKTVAHASSGVCPRRTGSKRATATTDTGWALRASCRALHGGRRVGACRTILGSLVLLVGRAVFASVADSAGLLAHLVIIVAICALNGRMVLVWTPVSSWAFRARGRAF